MGLVGDSTLQDLFFLSAASYWRMSVWRIVSCGKLFGKPTSQDLSCGKQLGNRSWQGPVSWQDIGFRTANKKISRKTAHKRKSKSQKAETRGSGQDITLAIIAQKKQTLALYTCMSAPYTYFIIYIRLSIVLTYVPVIPAL